MSALVFVALIAPALVVAVDAAALLALAAAALLVLMLLTLAVAVILVLILVGHDWFLSSVDAGECAAFTRAYKTRVMTKGFLKEQHGTRRSLSQLDSLCGEVIMDTGDSAPVARFASAAIAVVLILAVVLLLRVTLG